MVAGFLISVFVCKYEGRMFMHKSLLTNQQPSGVSQKATAIK